MSNHISANKNNQKLKQFLLLTTLSLSFIISGCGSDGDSDTEIVEEEAAIEVPSDNTSDEITDTDFQITDWTDATHSKGADPDFDEVFDNTQIKRFDFVVTPERWQSMLDNMTDLYGEFGQRTTGPGGELSDEGEDPIFVPSDVYYNNKQWYRVGIRFKGNSSLQTSWQQGILKLSFKLDFDEFEDDYPQIDNQRFYGFKKFSLKNNYDDQSFLREKIAADVWLYNRDVTPLKPEWPDPEKMPFANPVDYAKDHAQFSGVDDISDVGISWDRSDQAAIEASVFLRGELFAVLVEKVKPGWCCMAKKDGPLAKVLVRK